MPTEPQKPENQYITQRSFSYLQYHGGIRPRHRFRRAEALNLEEREDISRGISHGYSIRFIAYALCRSLLL